MIITPEEVKKVIQKFPNKKALGLDNILNEVLKIITPIIAKELAQAVIELLWAGNIP